MTKSAGRLGHDLINEFGLILNYAAVVAQELQELVVDTAGSERFDLVQIDLAEVLRAADRGIDLTRELQALAESGGG